MANHHALRDIFLSSIFATVPMLLLTATLVGFVLKYLVGPDVDVPQDGAFYLHVDSTLPVFIASWMSSLAPFLTASLINLTTYPVSKGLLDNPTKREQHRFLTPLQFGLALKIIHGSTAYGLWGWICHKFGWRERSKTRNGPIVDSLSFIALISTLLGLSVFAADTWLHVATSSRDAPETSVIDTVTTPYSLTLREDCLQTDNSFAALNSSRISCTLKPNNGSAVPRVYGAENALLTLNNLSNNLSIATNAPVSNISYLSIAPTHPNPQDNYVARTYAALTTCTPISTACDLKINESVTFNCSNGAFARESTDLTDSGLISQCFLYSNMSDTTDIWKYKGVNNPFYVAGATLNTVAQGQMNPSIIADPEAVTDAGVVLAAVHMCTVSIYDVEYEIRKGNFVRFDTTLSNTSVTNAFMAPYCATRFGAYNSNLALNIAVQLAHDFPDFGTRLAASISTNVAAAGVGAVQFAPAESVERTNSIVVARMPKAPFFLLVTLNLIFVLLGAVLTILALLTSEDVRKVQFRLTISGIVAAFFGGFRVQHDGVSADYLYDEMHDHAEDVMIGINKTSAGNFVLAAVSASESPIEKTSDLVFHGMTVCDEKRNFPSLYIAPVSDETVNHVHLADLKSWNRFNHWL